LFEITIRIIFDFVAFDLINGDKQDAYICTKNDLDFVRLIWYIHIHIFKWG